MNRLFDTSVYLWTQCADDFLCPVYIGHIWNDILGYPVKTCEACSLCHHYTDHFFRVSDTLLHLPDGNDRVYGARHGGNCNLSSNNCGSDLRMSRFSGGYVSGHPCILSSGGCGTGNG